MLQLRSGEVRKRLLYLWLAVLFVVSVVPVPQVKLKTFVPSDLIAHFVLYGITAVLFLLILGRSQGWGRSTFLRAVFFSTLYGVFIEVVQFFLPYRSFSGYDIIANFLGALLAPLLVQPFLRKGTEQ